MASTIEAKVQELVAVIVRRTEREVEAAFVDAIERELQQRRNGDVLAVERRCGGRKSAGGRDEAMPPLLRDEAERRLLAPQRDVPGVQEPTRCASDGASVGCRASTRSRTRRDRPRRRMVGARLVGHRIAADDERRREIERARANGLTTELRDGRIFTVLHLPPHRPAGMMCCKARL